MIKKLLNKLFCKRPIQQPALPITYGIHVFMREAGERLRHMEDRIRDLDRRITEMDDGQAQAVVTAKMEFETLTEAWKTGLQTQIHRNEEMIGEVVAALNQIENELKSP